MPVTPTVVTEEALQLLLVKAFKRARDDGSKDDAVSDNVIRELCFELASAFNSFIVGTIVTINPGVPVAGTSPSGPIAGTTVGPGTS